MVGVLEVMKHPLNQRSFPYPRRSAHAVATVCAKDCGEFVNFLRTPEKGAPAYCGTYLEFDGGGLDSVRSLGVSVFIFSPLLPHFHPQQPLLKELDANGIAAVFTLKDVPVFQASKQLVYLLVRQAMKNWTTTTCAF